MGLTGIANYPRASGKALHNSLALVALTTVMLQFSTPAAAIEFSITNLVTDDQSANPALLTDPRLVNAWGIAASPTSPLWIGDNGTGQSTLYAVNPATGAVTLNLATHPTIPGDGSVTGVAWSSLSGAGAFNGDNFLFVSEDGTISGWRGALGGSAETLQLGDANNIYKGTTFLSSGGHGYLLSANFFTGAIDVLKGDAGAPNLPGSFVDPNIPSGYAPFDIRLLGSNVFVTYAEKGAGRDEIDGLGKGFVDEFDLNGNFVGRVGSGGTLNAPWGLAIAPASFGLFAGDLLVGNFGDGTINIFDLGTKTFVDQLRGLSGEALIIDGLWALTVGSGAGNGGSASALYFTAGPNEEGDGLFGVINPVPEPASITMFALGLLGLGFLKGCASRSSREPSN